MKQSARPKRSANPDPIDVHVGLRLRLRRNLLGLSQAQLGRASGLTFQQIQKYERGTNRVGASRLFSFAQLLGVPVGYFFDEMGIPLGARLTTEGFAEQDQAPLEKGPSVDGELLHRKETLDLIRAYYKVEDRETRRKILALVKSLSS